MSTQAESWRPTASLEMLRARAGLLARIRDFFHRAGVLEVETPLCSAAGTCDPAIDSLPTRYIGPLAPQGLELWLHTSPEFAMKRLLAAGSGPIYQVCKVFRDGERGGRHNPEFTLLEWYRPGFDHLRLMEEVGELVNGLLPDPLPVVRVPYRELFRRHLGLDSVGASLEELRDCAVRAGIAGADRLDLPTRDGWLDLLLSHCIEPKLGRGTLCFVHDYPPSQAALARIRPGATPDDPTVAERFELYMEGIEIANGFHELADAAEQGRRFAAEIAARAAEGRSSPPADRRLLAALAAGFPPCAGVALGVDRLLMRLTGARTIDEVIAFPPERA